MMTVEDVCRWLEAQGFGRWLGVFRDNEIDAEILATLDEADLEKLGLPLGPRRKLLKLVAALGAAPVLAEAPSIPFVPTRSREAERRQLTVMFVDLVGSTALSRRLDPEDMGQILKAYQNAVVGEISRLDGFVAKLMGDGVLAYFGWPKAHEDEAERAVRAGLAIVGTVAKLASGSEPLACRVGIATGLVVVGDLIGEGASQEEAVVGDTPNLAARLQSLAEPGQVVVAEATRRLLGAGFAVESLGPSALKGIEPTTEAFRVLGERAVESRYASRAGESVAPMVGRDEELALLLRQWREAVAGEGRAVLIVGEAGIGKSRIIQAMIDALTGEPHTRIRYQCSPYHTDSAFWPVTQQLTIAAGLTPADPPSVRLDKIEMLLRSSAAEPGIALPLLAELLGLDGEARWGRVELGPQQRRHRTLEALLDQLVGTAGRSPVLLVLEDAHWIDPTTLELIELALDRIGAARVLMLVTARPTFQHTFGGHPIVTRLALNRLGREQINSIVQRLSGDRPLPEKMLDEIAARTDGVPLYVEELTKAVIETGRASVPASLHDSLMARLDRIPEVKEVAQIAACIGRSFDYPLLATVADRTEGELLAALDRLGAAELLFRRGTPPEATFLFKHALVRDAAYESLLKSRRSALHARLLDALERRSDASPEVKAQHAEAAGAIERAIAYRTEAGRQALARPAFREAIANLEAAIRLCQEAGEDRRWRVQEQDLQLQLGQAFIANRGYQAETTGLAFTRALELAESLEDHALALPAVFGLWASRYTVGAPFVDLAERFTILAQAVPESGPRVVGLRMLALESFHAGRFAESLELVERALAAYDPVTHRDLAQRFGQDPRSATTNYKAWNLWHLGFPEQADAAVRESLAWAREIGHANTVGIALCFGVQVTNIWLGRTAEVERAARESLRLADEMSMALWHAWAQMHLGWALAMRDDPTGLDLIEAGLAAGQRIGVGRLEALHRSLAAEAYALAGRPADAFSSIDKAFVAFEQSGDLALGPELYRRRARLRLLRADRDAARDDLQHALDMSRSQSARSPELRAAMDLARLWAEQGERQRARDLLAPIFARFTEGFEFPDLVEAKALLEELR